MGESDRTVRACGLTFQHPGLLSLLILLAVSWSTGGYQAYQQVLPLVFADEGSAGTRSCNETLSQQFQADDGDLFALASGLTYAFIIFTMPPPPFLSSDTSVGVRFGP